MKLLKKDTKPFLGVLHKLTDNRFKFSLVRSADDRLSVEMYFCDEYICSSPIQDFTISWTDEMLYKKYNLNEQEIAFIESMIRPMASSNEESDI